MGKAFTIAWILLVFASLYFIFKFSPPIVIYTPPRDVIQPTLRNPNMWELRLFLMEDQTDRIGETLRWRCIDYAINLRNEAIKRGLDVDIVLLDFDENRGHAINGCKLSDGRYVYIEPQTDDVFEDLEVGMLYMVYRRAMGRITEIRVID